MEADILGLGPTLTTYKKRENVMVFGVNDIFRHHPVQYLVTVDSPLRFLRFPGNRLDVMCNSTPEIFFTNRKEWEMYENVKSRMQLIELTAKRSDLTDAYSVGKIPFSNNSTFVAAILAYRMGAKKIIMYGVDFTGHHTLGKDNHMRKAIQDFQNLYLKLRIKGCKLCVSSAKSSLSKVLPVCRPLL